MSDTHRSPWLAQLAHDRPGFHLGHNVEVDVAIVGAGIAGISTAYYILKETNLRVALIEAGRIAHGATGHNAGQLTSYFERPFTELIAEFGMEKTAHAQRDVEAAWYLIEDIVQTCGLRTPLYQCMGYAGLSDVAHLLECLEEHRIRTSIGLPTKPIWVMIDPKILSQIPKEYESLYSVMPHSSILNILQTDNSDFIAAVPSAKGCMNSALFCEELAGYMATIFGDRLTIAEHLPVEKVTLQEGKGVLQTVGPSVTAHKIVLCTNGFETVSIENQKGSPIEKSFHALIQGMIGYMVGYFDIPDDPPAAISYYVEQTAEYDPADPYREYMYITRRPYEQNNMLGNLICMGGPNRLLPDRADYDPRAPFPVDMDERLERAMRLMYRDNNPPGPERAFAWHGVMGYTRSGVRCIGTEPRNDTLLYNLGCNGVGILPSIHGAKRIAQILKGTKLPPSMFDPVFGDTTS